VARCGTRPERSEARIVATDTPERWPDPVARCRVHQTSTYSCDPRTAKLCPMAASALPNTSLTTPRVCSSYSTGRKDTPQKMTKPLRVQGFRHIAGARYVPLSDARILQKYRLAA
jgi:hypothetical protein